MKLKDAIKILIEHTARDLTGSGCGISTIPSISKSKEAKEAIKRAWKYVYGREMCDSEKYNLRMRWEE